MLYIQFIYVIVLKLIYFIVAYPDVEVRTVTTDWEFVVIACDGIWDVMSSEEVVGYVRENMAFGIEPEEICENLMMRCLAPDCQMAGLGCDNMTVVIIGLLQDGTYTDLTEKCKRPPPPSSPPHIEEDVDATNNTTSDS